MAAKVREDWPRISTYFSLNRSSTSSGSPNIAEVPKSNGKADGAAPSTPINSPMQVVGSDLPEKAEKLRQLKKLKDEGILTEDEYEKKRKLIVEGL